MVAYFPAPALCQRDDEDIIIEIATIVLPDFVQRNRSMNGLSRKVEGDYQDKSLLKIATDEFQILLGLLRAWRPEAGQRVDEIRPGIGSGSIRDEHGNQVLIVGSAIAYTRFGSEVETYARNAKIALERSPHLRNALWLRGRRDRNAADFYMIYEYIEEDFAGRKAIVATLGFTNNDITRLRNSGNNLAPTEGGAPREKKRHRRVGRRSSKAFIARLLKRWIECRARAAA